MVGECERGSVTYGDVRKEKNDVLNEWIGDREGVKT